MMTIGEAFVPLNNSGFALRKVIEKLAPFYIRRVQDGPDYILEFPETTVRLRDELGALWLRVEGSDLAMFLGTKTLVMGQLFIIATDMPSEILWVQSEAGREPFTAIKEYAAGWHASGRGSDG